MGNLPPKSTKIQVNVMSEQSDIDHVNENKVRLVLHCPGHSLCNALIECHWVG